MYTLFWSCASSSGALRREGRSLNRNRGDVFSVEIATGDRQIISGDASLLLLVDSDLETLPRIIGGGPPLARPQRIMVDGERQVAYVTDSLYDAIVAVDLGSGYWQIVAK